LGLETDESKPIFHYSAAASGSLRRKAELGASKGAAYAARGSHSVHVDRHALASAGIAGEPGADLPRLAESDFFNHGR
jgi:hypothetical protein